MRTVRRLRITLFSCVSGILLLATCAGAANAWASRTQPGRPTGTTVNVWLTTADLASHLSPQPALMFGGATSYNPLTITVDESRTMQQMDGFGAGMTDSSAWLIANAASPDQSATLMSNLFDPNNGIGVSFVRVPMGASDFTASPPYNPAPYSYDDLPPENTDPSLSRFSINHDTAYILPLLQQAMQLNPNLKLLATPWSPPGWMKTNGSMLGTYDGNQGTLQPSAYGPLANYFVNFLQAYAAQGVPVYAISPQNEPTNSPADFPGMTLQPGDEANFIQNYLGPALASANLQPKILAGDVSYGFKSYIDAVLGDVGASSYVAGTAWHCYQGDPSAMAQEHDAHPAMDVYDTECSTGSSGIAPVNASEYIIRGTQNWAQASLLWNIALDPNSGPVIGTGCTRCTGLVTIDESTGNVTYLDNYYQLGQASKFVMPGAYHIASNTFGAGSIEDVAFSNPDGSKALLAYNSSPSSQTFQVLWGDRAFTYTLPAGATATFTWTGTPSYRSSYAVNAGGPQTGTFTGDGYFDGGTTYSTSASIDLSGASNPAPEAVYQSERYGTFSYTFGGLSPGTDYNARLHFAELYYTSAGKRQFDVSINGQQVLTNFDVLASAGGANRALTESFTAVADGNGEVTIQFSPGAAGQPAVNGIEVQPLTYTGGTPHLQVAPVAVALTTSPGQSPAPQTVEVQNSGSGTLSWNASALPSWVTASPASGMVAPGATQFLTLSFSTPSTSPQTYTTTLSLSDPNADNSPQSLPVTVVSANVSRQWYFAEGYTGANFTTYLTLANPNSVAANVQVSYLLGEGGSLTKSYTVKPDARSTLNVNTEAGAGHNVSMVVTSDQPIVAERPMYFTFSSPYVSVAVPGGTDVLGATALGTSFDFGSIDTTTDHATFLTILNQNTSPLTATIAYYPAAGGAPITTTHGVAANSRGTVNVNRDEAAVLPAGTYSAVVTLSAPGLVERPMYLRDATTGYTGSADVVGVAQPSTSWSFAEGYTGSNFSERYILSNPSSGYAWTTLTLYTATGGSAATTVMLFPGQQRVVDAATLIGNGVNNSATVSASRPILAERFESFLFTGAVGSSGSSSIPGATDVLGAGAASNLFYFAEGYTGGQFAEYLTLANLSATQQATVTVTFLPATGAAPVTVSYVVNARSRFTVTTSRVMPQQSFSMIVESNVPIVAERPMYFSYGGAGQTGGSDIVGYQP